MPLSRKSVSVEERDALEGTSGTPSSTNKYVTDLDSRNTDTRTPTSHNLGGSEHSSDTLANLNSKVSDATLDDSSDSRTPASHSIAGSEHSSDTLANLNSKVSDATLDDSSDSRTPTSHASGHITGAGDEIDGDKLNIDFTPSNYTPTTAPAEATDLDDLTAHLAGLDNSLSSSAVFDTIRFVRNSTITVTLDFDGAWIANRGGTVTGVRMHRFDAGTGGSTIVDVNKNGVTLFTTQGNRPTITAASGDDQSVSVTPDITSFVTGDVIAADIDAVETGGGGNAPQGLSLIIEVQY